VAVLQKLDVHTKEKWTHIGRKQNIQLTKNSISHIISQCSKSATNRIQGTINRIQDTKHRKTTAYTETTKHENKEKAIAGNQPGPSSL
jgi:hypothetical protein